jgi:chlorophyllide a reductase subunit Y
MRGLLMQKPISGRITLSGYEGSELLVGRLLIECGADLRYVGSACPATEWNAQDIAWLQAKGVQVQMRASLEQDLNAMYEYRPQLAIGTTPVVQIAKQNSVPSLYFTNLISARPLMGVAGAGSLVQVVQAAMGNQARFDAMKSFFGDVGAGHAAGVWESVPKDRPEFKAETRRQLEKILKKRKAEEMGS